MHLKLIYLFIGIAVIGIYACNSKSAKTAKPIVTYKGLYSYGPEVKSFKECANSHEFWVADSSAQLELQYSQLNFEEPNEPVYIEVQGNKIKSPKDGLGSDYDSILVVKKLLKLTKDIPKTGCN
jgi:copper homeostasis protein (lipoprotein)